MGNSARLLHILAQLLAVRSYLGILQLRTENLKCGRVALNAVAIIPARYGSTRFPGKPLARETGKFLVQHVVEQTERAKCFDRVMVATDDARVLNACHEFGVDVAMTREDHTTGTDRIAEVAAGIEFTDDTIFVNVQGDEPELDPKALEQLVARMEREPECRVGTLACPFPPDIDPADPNRVKVVVDLNGKALLFSRALIPYPRSTAKTQTQAGVMPAGGIDSGGTTAESTWLLHMGVYAFRRDFLLAYSSWPPGRLEKLEKLEQLRILERGHPIAVEIVPRGAEGIDTPDDYARFVQRSKANPDQAAGQVATDPIGNQAGG